MKLQRFFCIAALVLLSAVPAFAAKADHSSSMGVATSLLQAITNNDFECFNDALSPQSREIVAAQQDPQKLFDDFSQNVSKLLKKVPEEQRPLVAIFLVSQFQRIAKKIDGKWYVNATELMDTVK